MSAKFAERLFILLDAAEGYTTRVSYMKRVLSSPGGRQNSLKRPEFEKIRKALIKKFPDVTVIEKEKAYEQFRGAAPQTVEELEDAFNTFNDCLRFQEAATTFFTESAEFVSGFLFDRSDALLAGVLDLVVGYARLQVRGNGACGGALKGGGGGRGGGKTVYCC